METATKRRNLVSASTAAAIACTLATFAWAPAALAQQNEEPATAGAASGGPAADNDDSNAIVVTAQRRSERLQDVPISVTALPAAELDAANITTVAELSRVAPGFTVGRQNQLANARLTIRGIGGGGNTAIDPSVATFVDEVYIARSGSIINSFFDIEQVELLRGPQGTLFGRNASAGAIALRSATPTADFGGFVDAQMSSFDGYRIEGAINAPLSPTFGLRLAGLASGHGGYAYSTYDRRRYSTVNTRGARLTAQWEPTDALKWTVRADFLDIGGDGLPQIEFLPETFTAATLANYISRVGANRIGDVSKPFDRISFHRNQGDLTDEQWGVSSVLEYELDSGFALRAINSYRKWSFDWPSGDLTFLAADTMDQLGHTESRSDSHEFQVVSPKDLFGGAFEFVGGLYYYHEDYNQTEDWRLGPDFCNLLMPLINPAQVGACRAGPQDRVALGQMIQSAKSYAAYAQGTVHLGDKIDFTAGLRWTRDKKDGSFNQTRLNPTFIIRAPESKLLTYRDTDLSYRFNLTFRPVERVMLFATASRGYKAGGFNSGFASAAQVTRNLGPETIKNYELGLKSELFDRRLTFNIVGFQSDVEGFQDRSYTGQATVISNAGDIRVRGFDVETRLRVLDGLNVSLTAEYLDAVFTSYPFAENLPGIAGNQDLTGKRPNNSPKWQGNASIDYRTDIGSTGWSLNARADLAFLSDINVGSTNNGNPQSIQDAYSLLSGRLGLKMPNDMEIYLFGTNLTKTDYCTYNAPNPLDNVIGTRGVGFTAIRCSMGAPREWGVGVSARF